jgi:hypothetical protein
MTKTESSTSILRRSVCELPKCAKINVKSFCCKLQIIGSYPHDRIIGNYKICHGAASVDRVRSGGLSRWVLGGLCTGGAGQSGCRGVKKMALKDYTI